GEAPREYRVAAWPTQGQSLFGGTPPREPPAAARFEGRVHTGSATVLSFTLEERAVVAARPAQVGDEVPALLRVAVALAVPPGAAAQSDPPATSYSIESEAPAPTEVGGAPGEASGDRSPAGSPPLAAPAARAGAPAPPLPDAARPAVPGAAAQSASLERDATSRPGLDTPAASVTED